jgi:hypothetical protein
MVGHFLTPVRLMMILFPLILTVDHASQQQDNSMTYDSRCQQCPCRVQITPKEQTIDRKTKHEDEKNHGGTNSRQAGAS